MCGGERERAIHVLGRSSVASTLGEKAGVRAYQTPGKILWILLPGIAVRFSCIEWSVMSERQVP